MFPAEMLDRLVADELQAHFPCAAIGRQIIVLEQTGSTNDAILRASLFEHNDLSTDGGAREVGLQLISDQSVQHLSREHGSFPTQYRSRARRSLARRWKCNQLPSLPRASRFST